MIAGRLKIVNESRFSTEEVEELVKFATSEIDLKGSKLLVVVQNNRSREYRGWANHAYHFSGSEHVYRLGRQFKATYISQVLLGSTYPVREHTRHGQLHDYKTWQEVLIGVTAHEAQHCQHYYDGAYNEKSGVRQVKNSYYGRVVEQRFRVGSERVEPKCTAFEWYMVRKYRASLETLTSQVA